jgi:hypothetical protein
MTAALHASDFVRLPFEVLKPVCAELGARVYVATNQQHALEGLFGGPNGFIVAIAPVDETIIPDPSAGDQIDELQMWSESIRIIVSHRLPPTLIASQALYESVNGQLPFLDLVARIRDTMRTMLMPEESTGVLWTYKGRQYIPVTNGEETLPAFALDFEITAAPPYPDGSPTISPPYLGGGDDDFEETVPYI